MTFRGSVAKNMDFRSHVFSVFAVLQLNDYMCCPGPAFSAAVQKFSISEHLAGLDGLAALA